MSSIELSSKWIKVSAPSPHVFHVELARRPVNAFSSEFWREYEQVFDRLSEHAGDVRVVVLSSALPRLFTAGLDLADAAKITPNPPADSDVARQFLAIRKDIREFQHAIGAPERCPFPVIAAVHGSVVGLGIDIISACDVRYADESSMFSIKEVDIGLAADIGTLAYLPKITANHSLARELAYTARFFSASEALSLGLLSKVVKGGREEVIKEALDLARVIAGKSPVAVAGTKRLITHARDHTVAENLEYTSIWNGATVQTKDIPETLVATKSKRAANFRGLKIAGFVPKL